ncbi:DUF2089 domain-containing protein [bacterium]|nr:DUF2089 domain-containing protein [candidate division CSSED10-310 bacterium]
MAYQISGGCPACGHQLMIAKYRCPNCQTEVSGQFASCRFCQLDAQTQHFILVFLAHRGNIKLVEKELGISYPTVRKCLQGAIDALHLHAAPDKSSVNAEEKMEILDRLEKGKIDYHTALSLLESGE